MSKRLRCDIRQINQVVKSLSVPRLPFQNRESLVNAVEKKSRLLYVLKPALKLFISVSHFNVKLANQLINRLKPFIKLGRYGIWHTFKKPSHRSVMLKKKLGIVICLFLLLLLCFLDSLRIGCVFWINPLFASISNTTSGCSSFSVAILFFLVAIS